MELLKHTQTLFPDIDLSDITLITCHHILEIDFLVLKAFFEKGLKPQNVYVIGKAYSTSEHVLHKYREVGIHVANASNRINPRKSFDDYFSEEITKFLDELAGRVKGNVIVWDDGGMLNKELIKRVGTLPFRVIASLEQTSSGFNALSGIDLKFPIVNMARSKAKLQFETPFIVEKNLKKLYEYLHQHNKSMQKVLIIGGGVIGREMKKHLLARGVLVDVFDVQSGASDFPENTTIDDILSIYDIIIGTTGKQVVSAEEIGRFKNDAIVMSVSSSDREFDAVGWRKIAHVESDRVHQDIVIDRKVLLNNGFPLNFDGAPESVPLQYISLTGALTLAGIYTAHSANSTPEWKNIPKRTQEEIVRKFNNTKQPR